MNKKLNDISFIDILPESVSKDEVIKNAAESLNSELKSINSSIKKILIYSRIDQLDSVLLSLLAMQFKTPFWNEGLELEEKRTLIKKTIAWHIRRGTPSAIEEAISTVFGDGELQEWWEYGGEPYHFRVKVDVLNQSLTDETYIWANKLIEFYKNIRSKLETFHVTLSSKGNSFGVPYFTSVNKVKVYPFQN